MTVDDTLVYWWDQQRDYWVRLQWDDFEQWLNKSEPLPVIPPGDQYFVVCVADDDGSICNILPHRYVFDDGGRRRRGDNGPLSDEDVAFDRKILVKRDELTAAEQHRFEEIQERIYRWCLPPVDAARRLFAVLPAPLGPGGVFHFRAAYGTSLDEAAE